MKPLLLWLIASIAVVSITACSASKTAGEPPVTITIGAMDNFFSSQDYSITRKENPLVYKTNGECRWGQTAQDCMWWGIHFQYAELEQDTVLSCTTVKVTDTEAGNLPGLMTPTRVSYQWTAQLLAHSKGKTLAFFSMPGKGEERMESHCVAQGLEPLGFSFVIRWPEQ